MKYFTETKAEILSILKDSGLNKEYKVQALLDYGREVYSKDVMETRNVHEATEKFLKAFKGDQ